MRSEKEIRAEALEEALRPFVREARRLGVSSIPADDTAVSIFATYGDIRRAIRALVSADKEKDGSSRA